MIRIVKLRVATLIALAVTFLILLPTVLAEVEGKVDPATNSTAAKIVASSVTSASLIRAAKAAKIYTYEDVPHVNWVIDDAVLSANGKTIIFAAAPVSLGGSGGSGVYVMCLNIQTKKLVALPLSDLNGIDCGFVNSPKSNKAIFYLNGREHYWVYVFDRETFKFVELILTDSNSRRIVQKVTVSAKNDVLFQLQGHAFSGENIKPLDKRVEVKLDLVPSLAQIRQAIVARNSKFSRYDSNLVINSIRARNGWCYCTIEAPNVEGAGVILKKVNGWRVIDEGTWFEDVPPGMPKGLLPPQDDM